MLEVAEVEEMLRRPERSRYYQNISPVAKRSTLGARMISCIIQALYVNSSSRIFRLQRLGFQITQFIQDDDPCLANLTSMLRVRAGFIVVKSGSE